MRNKSSFGLIALHILATAGCATTQREKVFQNMAIAAAAGFAIGQTSSEAKNNYSLMYAGLAATGAGVATLYYSNIDDENKKLKEETKKLKEDLDQLLAPRLEKTTPGTMAAKIPEKFRSLVSPGEWRLYAVDQWIEDGENRLIHQDKIMELVPPSLTPRTLPTIQKESKP